MTIQVEKLEKGMPGMGGGCTKVVHHLLGANFSSAPWHIIWYKCRNGVKEQPGATEEDQDHQGSQSSPLTLHQKTAHAS